MSTMFKSARSEDSFAELFDERLVRRAWDSVPNDLAVPSRMTSIVDELFPKQAASQRGATPPSFQLTGIMPLPPPPLQPRPLVSAFDRFPLSSSSHESTPSIMSPSGSSDSTAMSFGGGGGGSYSSRRTTTHKMQTTNNNSVRYTPMYNQSYRPPCVLRPRSLNNHNSNHGNNYTNGMAPVPADNTRSMQIALLLREHQDGTCPLLTLIQEYQSRFQQTLHVSELYTMRHLIEIHDFGGNRTVRLLPSARARNDQTEITLAPLDPAFCVTHCPKNFIVNPDLELPFVKLALAPFADRVHQLLNDHGGSLPLASFPQCYAHSFEHLEDCDDGIPLEHLISCIKDVQIVCSQGVIKKIQFSPPSYGMNSNSLALDSQSQDTDAQQRLQQFGREVLDLLKNSVPHCRLPVSRFVSAYHQHFNRQCRVADYGYARIIDLLQAIPKTLQLLGDGNKRIMTLTHRCQLKRFVNDIVRILKNRPQRTMPVSEIPTQYEATYKKQFDVLDFGLCSLDDLVCEVAENKELVVDFDKNTIRLYRKERSNLEQYATRIFEKDLIDMLRVLPDYAIPFQKFIPSYHHHFGFQCKVTVYGFQRLIDLLEELPHAVKVHDDRTGEKIVQLTHESILRAVSMNIEQLIRQAPLSAPIKMNEIQSNYLNAYRMELNPEEFGFDSLEALLATMSDKLEFRFANDGNYELGLAEYPSPAVYHLAKHVVLLLMLSQCQTSFWQLKQDLLNRYQMDITLSQCRNELQEYVEIHDTNIRLTPPFYFAYNVVILLGNLPDGRMPYEQFLTGYQRRSGVDILSPFDYGFPTMARLFDAIQLVAVVRGRRIGRTIMLQPEFRIGCSALLQENVENSFYST